MSLPLQDYVCVHLGCELFVVSFGPTWPKLSLLHAPSEEFIRRNVLRYLYTPARLDLRSLQLYVAPRKLANVVGLTRDIANPPFHITLVGDYDHITFLKP
eukprot:COSAG02_NODE_1369_length_13028_cov_2.767345_6_plen_100_part_00